MEAFFCFMHKVLIKSVGLYINLLSYIAPSIASQMAYRLFSEPRSGKLYPDKMPSILLEAEMDTLTHNNTTLQTYTWKGNEQIILLVHGWESNASRWEPFINILKKSGSTIIALDAPAHGLSSGKEFNIPKYAEFVSLLVIKHQPQFIVGHSLGGATTLYFLNKYKNDSLSKVVLLGTPSELRTIINNYVNLLSLNTKVFQLLEKRLFTYFRIRITEFSGKKFASKLKIKGLIVHDIEDNIVAFKEGKEIAKTWKSSKFIETKGLGHSLHDNKLYHRIYDFLFNKEENLNPESKNG